MPRHNRHHLGVLYLDITPAPQNASGKGVGADIPGTITVTPQEVPPPTYIEVTPNPLAGTDVPIPTTQRIPGLNPLMTPSLAPGAQKQNSSSAGWSLLFLLLGLVAVGALGHHASRGRHHVGTD